MAAKSKKSSKSIAFIIALSAILWLSSGFIQDIFETQILGLTKIIKEDKNTEFFQDKSDLKNLTKVRTSLISSGETTSETVLLGRTAAVRKIKIKAKTEGTVLKINMPEGSYLKEGMVILKLSMQDRAAKLEEAKALVAQREIEYNASKRLTEEGYSSIASFAKANADLESARAELSSIDEDIKRTEIKAPFDGILNILDAEQGDYLRAGDIIGEYIDLDPIVIEVHVSEKNLNKLRLGDIATVKLLNGNIAEGNITYISSTAEADTRTFKVEIELDNTRMELSEGLTSEIILPLREDNAALIPPSILTLNDKGDIGVKAVNEDNIVVFYPVSIIKHNQEGIWISGLPPVCRIITVGQEYVKEGVKVETVDESSLK